MYKLIFIDLDGTLLNDAKEISEENIKMLNKVYTEKGIKTIITTGRPVGFVQDLCNKYNCSFGDYVIASNGTIIKNLKTNEYINKGIFSKKEVKELREIYLNEKLDYFMLYTEDEEYREEKDINIQKKQKEKCYVENTYEIIEKNKDLDVVYCVYGGNEKDLKKVIKILEKLNKYDISAICEYNEIAEGIEIKEKYFDVVKKGYNKKNAAKKVMEKLNVNYDEVIVIGDGGNDLTMFENAKLKIAMGNGSEILKQKADYIADSNNNNGVAKAIKKFIF